MTITATSSTNSTNTTGAANTMKMEVDMNMDMNMTMPTPTPTPTPAADEMNSANATSTTNSETNNNNKGNLHSLLKAYDQNQQNGVAINNYQQQQQQQQQLQLQQQQQQLQQADNVSLGGETTNSMMNMNMNLTLGLGGFGGIGRDRSSTLGSIRDIRERGLTFGSEFDLGLGLGLGLGLNNENDDVNGNGDVGGDGDGDGSGVAENDNDNVSRTDTAVFDLSAVGGSGGNGVGVGNTIAGIGIGGTNINNGISITTENMNITNISSGGEQSQKGIGSVVVSAGNSNASGVPVPTSIPITGGGGDQQQQTQQHQQQQQQDLMMQDNSNHSGFVNKMFNQSQQQSKKNHTLRGHTPPSATATSYEMKHFGKRVRSGSLSGRLRSMSDLEDRGIIDSNQKGILKDLIISGDDELMVAVEQYERGDTAALESMIRSGALRKRHVSDIDLLGDLDLDFLSMNEDFAGGPGGGGGSAGSSHNAGGNNNSSGTTNNMSKPIPIKNAIVGMMTRRRSRTLSENSNIFLQHSSSNHDNQSDASNKSDVPYDGIGDLDFNADYINSNSNHNHGSNSAQSQQHQIQVQQQQQHLTKQRADSIFDAQRNRANSLAFGSLLDDGPSEDANIESVGKWMDRTPAILQQEAQQPQAQTQQVRKMPLKKRVSSQVVGANGGFYIINNDSNNNNNDNGEEDRRSNRKTRSPKGRGRSTTTTRATTRSRSSSQKQKDAEQRKREREEKKAAKEREKLEKKAQREREKLEKKEMQREARESKKAGRKKKSGESTRKKKGNMGDFVQNGVDGVQSPSAHGQEEGDSDEPKVIVSGTGRPRSLSDPNLSISLDQNGLMQIDHPPDWVGAYSPESRKIRIERFLAKRNHRVWVKKVKYDVRKNFADSRLRVKGRFVKKEDELLMRDLMSLT